MLSSEPHSVPSCPQNLVCSHVSRGFLLVLVLLFFLIFVFLLFLGVKVFTTNVEQLLHLQYITRTCGRVIRESQGIREKAPRKSPLWE